MIRFSYRQDTHCPPHIPQVIWNWKNSAIDSQRQKFFQKTIFETPKKIAKEAKSRLSNFRESFRAFIFFWENNYFEDWWKLVLSRLDTKVNKNVVNFSERIRNRRRNWKIPSRNRHPRNSISLCAKRMWNCCNCFVFLDDLKANFCAVPIWIAKVLWSLIINKFIAKA